MPLTEEQKRQLTIQRGFNPDEVEFVEFGAGDGSPSVLEDESILPPVADNSTPPVNPSQPQYSRFDALKTHAVDAALPTVAGLGAAAGVARFVPSGAGQLAAIPASILAGVGTSMLQRRIQTPEFQQKLASTRQQHPYTSIAGGIIPSLMAFRPGVSELEALRKGIGNLPRAHLGALTAPQKAVMANAALNTSLQGGMSAYNQLADDRPGFNVGEFAAETIPGAFLTTPTRVGQRMGFKPVQPDTQEPLLMPEMSADIEPPVIPPRPIEPSISTESPEVTLPYEGGYKLSVRWGGQPTPTGFEPTKFPVPIKQPIRIDSNVEQSRRELDFLRAQKEQAQQEVQSAIETEKQNIAQLKQLAQEAQTISQPPPTSRPYVEPPVSGVDLRQLEKKMRKNVGGLENIEEGNVRLSEESPISEPYNPHAEYESPVTEPVSPELREYQFALARRRGVRPYSSPEVSSGGLSIAGKYNPSKRRMDISESRQRSDTTAHETLEAQLEDLRTSTHSSDKALYDRTVQAGRDRLTAGKLTESEKGLVQRMKDAGQTEEQISLELAIRDAGVTSGIRDLSKIGKLKSESTVGEWARDLTAWLKHKTGLAKDEDVFRLLAAQREHEAPFGTRNRYASETLVKDTLAQQAAQQKPPVVEYATNEEAQQGQEKALLADNDGSQEEIIPITTKKSEESPLDLTSNKEPIKRFKELEANKKRILDQIESDRQKMLVAKTSVEREFYADSIKKNENLHQILDNQVKGDFGGVEYEGGGNEKHQASSPLEKEIHIPVLKPEIEKVKTEYGPQGKILGEHFEKFYDKYGTERGQYVNKPTLDLKDKLKIGVKSGIGSYIKQDNESAQKVLKHAYDLDDFGTSSLNLSPEEQQGLKYFHDYLKSVTTAQASRSASGMATPTTKLNQVPHLPSRKVLNTILNKPQSPEAATLIKDFYDYQINAQGKTKGEADKLLEIFRRGHSKKYVNTAEQFAPIDRADELRLPSSWREQNLLAYISHFGDRVARRFAFFDNLDKNNKTIAPVVTKAMSEAGNSDVATRVWYNIQGVQPHAEVWRDAVGGLIRAGMLGPLTGAKDFANNLTLGFQHQTIGQAIRSPLIAWSNLRNGLVRESLEQGVNRINIGSLEMGDAGIGDTISALRRTRDIINDVQGRNFFEKMARATAYGQGKWLVMDNLAQHRNGKLSSQGRRFLNSFMPEYKKPGFTPTVEQIRQSAKRYAESIQGTYDYRGLPEFAVSGSLSPVFSLSRWSIEKANNYAKHVLTPLRNGDPRPFLMSTLGMVIGGAAIEILVEKMTGRKSKLPTSKEVEYAFKEDKNKWDALAYKAAGLASYAGYAGMLGDLAKGYMDHKFKNRPQGYENVLLDAFYNVKDTSTDLIGALDSNEPDAIVNAVSQFLEGQVQAYRLLLSHTSEEKQNQMEKQSKFRDVKMFKTLNDLPVNEPLDRGSGNAIAKTRENHFKETGDLREAQQLIQQLVKEAFEEAKGQPEKLDSKLKGLKANNYQTFPSIDNQPIQAMRYMDFLKKTQGSKEASSRFIDNIKQREINKAKSQMVP